MEVENKITVYEVDGVETLRLHVGAEPLAVRSHPTYSKFVILQWGSGKRLTVAAADLQRAATNATNTKY